MVVEHQLGRLLEEMADELLAGKMDPEPSTHTMEVVQPTAPETAHQHGNPEPRRQPTVSTTTQATKPPHMVAATPGDPRRLPINHKPAPRTINLGKTPPQTTTGALQPTTLPRLALICLLLLLRL